HTSSAWISLNENSLPDKQERLEQGLIGAANALGHIAPLFVMCDPQDIHVVPQVKAAHNEKPTIFFYDRYPGGVGLSEKIYEGFEHVLHEARQMVGNCLCEQGCPSCIGTETASNSAKADVLN